MYDFYFSFFDSGSSYFCILCVVLCGLNSSYFCILYVVLCGLNPALAHHPCSVDCMSKARRIVAPTAALFEHINYIFTGMLYIVLDGWSGV